MGSIMKPRFPRMFSRERRLSSFDKWPKKHLNIEDFVYAGFYYTGINDEVKCFWCCGIIDNWEVDNDPFQRHKEEYPECIYVKRYDLETLRFCKSESINENVPSNSLCQHRFNFSLKNEKKNDTLSDNPLLCTLLCQHRFNFSWKIEKKNDKLSDNPLLCALCFNEEKQICFETCGHVVCCASCSEELQNCPMCRSVIRKRIKIYLS